MKTEASGIWDRMPALERTRDFLSRAAARPGDSYLFVGPDRTKAEAAKIFAAAILCRPDCGECETCRRALAGLHPDLHIFEPEGYTFPVEVIRQIVVTASQTPMEADRRVFILDEAHRITERSQNALLKALEEPASSVTWILTADSLEPLLPTILSRCQVVDFPPMAEEAIAGLLETRFGLSPAQASGYAAMAPGDLEKAIALATDEVARRVRDLALKAAFEPTPTPAWALDFAESVHQLGLAAKASVEEAHKNELAEFDESMGKGRGSAAPRKRLADRHKRALRRAENDVFLSFLLWLSAACRDMAAASFGSNPAKIRSAAEWLNLAEESAEGHLAIRENAAPALVVESILLKLVP
ncbi:MAG: ATP-binding protein [Actinomycetota bacterium]